MTRLLIVDDEALIVDGLYEHFIDLSIPEVDVYRAYSGEEAISIIDEFRVDILLTDIQMPGIDGIRLLNYVKRKWFDCRVVILSCHEEFDYIYAAIKYEKVEYVLKTEGFDIIESVILRCISDIKTDVERQGLIARAQNQLEAATPLFQKEFFEGLLSGDQYPEFQTQLDDMKINLSADEPILVALGQLNENPNVTYSSGFSRISYAVKYAAEQILNNHFNTICIILDRVLILWVLQIRNNLDTISNMQHEWEHLVSTAKGDYESVQRICRGTTQISLSMIISGNRATWSELPMIFFRHKAMLYKYHCRNEGLLVVDNFDAMHEPSDDIVYGIGPMQMQILRKRCEEFEYLLENGKKKEFEDLFRSVISSLVLLESTYKNIAIEALFTLKLFFLSFINKKNMMNRFKSHFDITHFLQIDWVGSWEDEANSLLEISSMVFDEQETQRQSRVDSAISLVKRYIDDHTNLDLSLDRLADLVHFSPNYLSRYFKQATGRTLFEYISETKLEKAKELLTGIQLKIYEIGVEIGYPSPPYFTRFFKKYMHVSPKEYRDSILKNGYKG